MKIEETEWFQKLKSYDYIMIFGAKSAAQFTYAFVKQIHVELECFLVSERRDNPFFLEGRPVRVFSEIDEETKRNTLVIISQRYESNDEMKKILSQAGFRNMISGVAQETFSTETNLLNYRRSILGKMRMAESVLGNDLQQNENGTRLCIYAVTSHNDLHKSNQVYESKYVKYIQAGAGLTDIRICNCTDDTGDNISGLNPYYCELTAGYWIYKNDHAHEYIGLYHYSRGLSVTDAQLGRIAESEIDAILPVPLVYRHEMLTRYATDADIVLQAVRRISPEYEAAAEKFFSEKIFFAGNIVISRREIFCRYYEWMFGIISECENIMKESKRMVTKRLWGYYGEVLTNIYFLFHMDEYQVVYSELKYMY